LKSIEAVEPATLEWVTRFNHQRLWERSGSSKNQVPAAERRAFIAVGMMF
jgi:hypothetical protein